MPGDVVCTCVDDNPFYLQMRAQDVGYFPRYVRNGGSGNRYGERPLYADVPHNWVPDDQGCGSVCSIYLPQKFGLRSESGLDGSLFRNLHRFVTGYLRILKKSLIQVFKIKALKSLKYIHIMNIGCKLHLVMS